MTDEKFRPGATGEAADARTPFFILGAPRSGTSLLSRMLNRHPNIAVPFETKLIECFEDLVPYYGNLAERRNLEDLIDDMLAIPAMREVRPPIDRFGVLKMIASPNLGGVFTAILTAWAAQQGKSRWGEKTLNNAVYWDLLEDICPDAKVLHIIRDGRDVALSLIKAPFGPKTVYSSAQRWAFFVERVRQIGERIGQGRYLELHYEELLADPQQVLEHVCRFLDEPFDPAMLQFHDDATPYPTDPGNDANLRRALMRENSGKWLRAMSPAELRVFEAVAHRQLGRFGYELAREQTSLSRLEQLYRRFVEPLPPKSVSMVRNKRGQREALARFSLVIRKRLLYRLKRKTNW